MGPRTPDYPFNGYYGSQLVPCPFFNIIIGKYVNHQSFQAVAMGIAFRSLEGTDDVRVMEQSSAKVCLLI